MEDFNEGGNGFFSIPNDGDYELAELDEMDDFLLVSDDSIFDI